MNIKINGRTPEEIKKGLEHCVKLTVCGDCPYSEDKNCDGQLFDDALAYIQQLERERDAAVEDLRTMGEHAPCCKTCFYDGTSEDEEPCMDCYAGYLGNYWEWRGVR